MTLPSNIRAEFIDALKPFSENHFPEGEDALLAAAKCSVEKIFLIANELGLTNGLLSTDKVFYKEGILFVVVDGEEIKIPE